MGSNTGVGPLVVDAAGNPLLGETLCDGNLFVTDSNGALAGVGLSPSTTEIKEVPTSLSSVTETWSAPGASVLTCDREGDIWALWRTLRAQPTDWSGSRIRAAWWHPLRFRPPLLPKALPRVF